MVHLLPIIVILRISCGLSKSSSNICLKAPDLDPSSTYKTHGKRNSHTNTVDKNCLTNPCLLRRSSSRKFAVKRFGRTSNKVNTCSSALLLTSFFNTWNPIHLLGDVGRKQQKEKTYVLSTLIPEGRGRRSRRNVDTNFTEITRMTRTNNLTCMELDWGWLLCSFLSKVKDTPKTYPGFYFHQPTLKPLCSGEKCRFHHLYIFITLNRYSTHHNYEPSKIC